MHVTIARRKLYEYVRHPRVDKLHASGTFKDAEAVLKEAEEIQNHLLAQDAAISSILERIQSLTPEPAPTESQ